MFAVCAFTCAPMVARKTIRVKYFVFKKSDVPNTIIIERDQYKVNTFQWIAKLS